MDAPTDDDPLLDMIESVALAVLERIGNDPDVRQFFKQFVELAKEITHAAELKRSPRRQ